MGTNNKLLEDGELKSVYQNKRKNKDPYKKKEGKIQAMDIKFLR
jgi:hypothetical protein